MMHGKRQHSLAWKPEKKARTSCLEHQVKSRGTSNATDGHTGIGSGILRQTPHSSEQPVRCAHSLAYKAWVCSLIWPDGTEQQGIICGDKLIPSDMRHAKQEFSGDATLYVERQGRKRKNLALHRSQFVLLPALIPAAQKPFDYDCWNGQSRSPPCLNHCTPLE